MKNIESVLTLKKLVFEEIEFKRLGFKNSNEIDFEFEIQIGKGKEAVSKVTLKLNGNKKDEYTFKIVLSGLFSLKSNDNSDDMDELINRNAVAILMPYLRSEVSLLTAQPGMDCVVLPPFNINSMMDKNI